MKYHSAIKQVVCQSCGLSLTRHELDRYWKKVRSENITEGLDKGIFELFLALKGLAFELRTQGLTPAFYAIPVFCAVDANGAAGHLGVSNRQAGVGIIHSIDSPTLNINRVIEKQRMSLSSRCTISVHQGTFFVISTQVFVR